MEVKQLLIHPKNQTSQVEKYALSINPMEFTARSTLPVKTLLCSIILQLCMVQYTSIYIHHFPG